MNNSELLVDVIEKIQNNIDVDEILNYCEHDLFFNGPIDTTTLEILSVAKNVQPEIFKKHESKIVRLMGLFFKQNNNEEVTDLQQLIMENYKESIQSIRNNESFTPMQNEILSKLENSSNYSFSSPTSTGKSYIFRYLIQNAKNDVMIIVPSRALINEFYIKVSEYVKENDTLILTFVEDINKKHTKKHIFILTPERAREVFKYHTFHFDFILFDEAQITNDHDDRAMYYDGIVRRLKKTYPSTMFIFAHPFIENPEVQFSKNEITGNNNANSFKFKNTGQLFICKEKKEFYIFGIDKKIMGEHKIKLDYDPIMKVLESNGTILIYTAKARIIKKSIFEDYDEYITKYCIDEPTEEMLEIINQIAPLIGATNEIKSYFLEYLKQGIVIHHGSMPLDIRILLEKFIGFGYCKICFSTATLAQGINMPFDLVFLDRFENKKSLLVKNIIGRAGRSSKSNIFDYGIVIVKDNMSNVRNIMKKPDFLDDKSLLDSDEIEEEKKEYRDAIKDNNFSDEYNLPNEMVKRTNDDGIEENIRKLRQDLLSLDKNKFNNINTRLTQLFNDVYLPHRKLNDFEKKLLREANIMLLWRYQGYKFSDICKYIYKTKKKSGNNFVHKYGFFPNKNLKYDIPLFSKDEPIDYDIIVYNTYDFFDKLIDLKLVDVYYSAFMEYSNRYDDDRVKEIAIKMKYGTSDDKQILELKYGFTSEDYEWLDPIIDKIDEDEIIFNEKANYLDDFKKEKIKKYRY